MADVVSFSVPGHPPSVNSYVRHARGRHYRTKAADRWLWDVSFAAKKQSVRGDAYEVNAVIWLGAKERIDIDNAGKLLLDSLVTAGVIDTDAKVVDLYLRKRRDAANPRTDITVAVIDG